MTRDETMMLMARVKAIWPGFARGLERQEKVTLIDVWSEKLLGVTPDTAIQALDVLRLDQSRLVNVPPNIVEVCRAVIVARATRLPAFDRMFNRLTERARELQAEGEFKKYLSSFAPPEVQRFAEIVGWEVIFGYPENGAEVMVLRVTWDRVVRESTHRGVGQPTQEIEHAAADESEGVGAAGRPELAAGTSQT